MKGFEHGGTGARARVAATLGAIACMVALVSLAVQAHPAGAGAPAAYELRPIDSQFLSPVFAAGAPGENDLLFVVEQEGRIQVLRDEQDVPGSFLDISNRVAAGGERGLFSVAFAPNFQASRRFYVYYTDNQGDIRVDEYRRRAETRMRAAATSRREVIEIPHPGHENHNGGTVAFGPDGHLYLATGDGGGPGDPGENAQDKSSLLGKLLRLDPTPAGGGAGYDVPDSNPFVGRGGRDEIYALGLRNPFRFSFDPPTDSIAIGDVGQSAWEEIDFESLASARGASFGWDRFEGNSDFEGSDPAPARYRPPIHVYPNDEGGPAAVTGGVVVRDPDLPGLSGRYVYADVYDGQIRALDPGVGSSSDESLGLEVPNPVAFGVGVGRQVYVVSLMGDVFALDPS